MDVQVIEICEAVIELLAPSKIIVFSEKTNSLGTVSDMDLCVVCEEERSSAVKTVYKNIASEIPFDLFVYSAEEWSAMHSDEGSFAARIARKGRLVYEK
jgi:hypothetical protein